MKTNAIRDPAQLRDRGPVVDQPLFGRKSEDLLAHPGEGVRGAADPAADVEHALGRFGKEREKALHHSVLGALVVVVTLEDAEMEVL